MPPEYRRIGLALAPSLVRSMRILGLTPAVDARDGVPADGATQVTSALARYADSVERAGRELCLVLDAQEWNLIADVMNGCADLWDYTESPMPILPLIRANVEDGHALDGAGYKWFGDDDRKGSDRRVRALSEKLRKLTPVQGDALAAAVRHFRRNCGDIDHLEARWWTPEFRTRPRTEGAADA
jgi:hypothetical protein